MGQGSELQGHGTWRFESRALFSQGRSVSRKKAYTEMGEPEGVWRLRRLGKGKERR